MMTSSIIQSCKLSAVKWLKAGTPTMSLRLSLLSDPTDSEAVLPKATLATTSVKSVSWATKSENMVKMQMMAQTMTATCTNLKIRMRIGLKTLSLVVMIALLHSIHLLVHYYGLLAQKHSNAAQIMWKRLHRAMAQSRKTRTLPAPLSLIISPQQPQLTAFRQDGAQSKVTLR